MSKPRLRDCLLAALSGTFLILIVSYTVIAGSYFLNGFDTLTKTIMRELYQEYADLIDRRIPFEQPRMLGFQISTSEEGLPSLFQWQLSATKLPYDELQVIHLPPRLDGPPGTLFLMRMQTPGKHDIFLMRQVYPDQVNPRTMQDIDSKMQQLVLIGIIALLLSMLMLVLLYRSVANPLQRLSQWAQALHPGTILLPHPDFRYSEINSLADMVQNSLHSARKALEREHSFLRHASHELRTPLTIISSNLQLLQRFRPPEDLISSQVLDRISRATDNMSQLAETLLWLNRQEDYPLDPEPMRLDAVIHEMIEANRHLISNKEVSLSTKLQDCTMLLPATPCRIIIANLVRNACQHTHSGVIHIQLSAWSELEIRNDTCAEAVPTENSDGFGLGLNLVSQLANRFGWEFSSEQQPNSWRSRLHFRSYNNDLNAEH